MVYNTQLQSKFFTPSSDPLPKMNDDHPIHPALVHFPIAFLTLSWGLDILYAFTAVLIQPSFLTTRFAAPNTLVDITRLGHFLLCAGLLTTVPAIMTGNIQLVGMIKKNGGPWIKDETGKQTDTMVPKIKLTITHALLNDIVFVAGLYSWWVRRKVENVGHVPNTTGLIISAILFPVLLFSASLGGTLTYNHGVGLNLGRKKVE